MNKKNFIVGVLLFVMILSIANVLALGVTPGRKTITYQEDKEEYLSFSVLNPDEEDMKVSFRVSGNLKDNVVLYDDSLILSSDEKSKEVPYSVIIDQSMLKPGPNEAEIIITEVPLDDESGMFSAVLSVATEIVINYPYPGKYIESAITIKEAGKNETTKFMIPVINRGEEDIENLQAVINITSKGQEVEAFESETISVKSMEREELDVDWIANVPMGVYQATIDLVYDDETATYYKTFQVGEVNVEVFDIFVEDFELGNIVTLNILVENEWNDDLKEVYANLILHDESGKTIADVKSPPYDVAALEKIRIPLHWDTAGVEEGEYTGKIKILSREGLSIERAIFAEINQYGIGIELESGGFVLEEPGLISLEMWIIIILLIGGIAFWIVFRKILKK